MEWYHYLLIGLGALVILFFAIILIRALAFKPKNNTKILPGEEVFDKDRAVDCLRELLTCKTISYKDTSLEDNLEFDKLIAKLPTLYPNVWQKCPLLRLPDRALLFKWEGKNHDNPSVMMSHYDVVPVDESGWEKPAFDGIIEDGVLWGRGALDTKVTLNGAMFSADTLIAQGFVPENDVYFAFSGCEETNGNGAVNIVNWFKEQGITPALVVDEGGGVVENVFPGVKVPCGLIGIAEKGLLEVEYVAKSNGGHASAPKPNSPLIAVSKAVCKVENNPFKSHLTKPVKEMFDTLGRHSSFVYRLIFANLWCFKWVLDLLSKKQGGEMNALMRTTTAFTQAKGSKASNVIPSTASIVSNMRLNPMDTVDSAKAYLEKTVNDDKVEIKFLNGINPSAISETYCPAYDKVAQAIASTWKGAIVSPYLMVQCSDSRHYGAISNHVYRFSAMDLTSEERATIHGHNERIRIECLHRSVEFYLRLLRQC